MFHHYETSEWRNIPTTDSIKGLAIVLEVDPDEVVAAAMESVGIETREVSPDRGTRAILGLLGGRTPEQIAALEQVVRSVADAMDTAGNSGSEPDDH
jgi:hypothetical protein